MNRKTLGSRYQNPSLPRLTWFTLMGRGTFLVERCHVIEDLDTNDELFAAVVCDTLVNQRVGLYIEPQRRVYESHSYGACACAPQASSWTL